MEKNSEQKKAFLVEKKKPFFLKNWWNKYIKRLNKITNGKL